MSTTWELIESCFADARAAEALVREGTARRELRLDPERALATFRLWRKYRHDSPRTRTPRRSRTFAASRP
jgi:hypothetical protein